MINVTAAKTSELVAFYNAHAERQIKKFVNRATAERRVQEIVDMLEAEKKETVNCPACGVDVEDNGYDIEEKTGATVCLGCGHKWGGEAVEIDANRSEAQRRAWANPEVKAARSKRYAVVVDGETYGSVAKAFNALGLPLNKHIKFRGDLRDAGKMDEFGYHWELVEKA